MSALSRFEAGMIGFMCGLTVAAIIVQFIGGAL